MVLVVDALPPVVVVKEPDGIFDDVFAVIYSLLVKLLDVEVVISLVVVVDFTTFVVHVRVGRLVVVLLVLLVTTSFVVVTAICPVAEVCHAITLNEGLPKKDQHIHA